MGFTFGLWDVKGGWLKMELVGVGCGVWGVRCGVWGVGCGE